IATFDQPDKTGFVIVPNVAGPNSAPPKKVRKYLAASYRDAAGFAKSRTQLTVTDDSYECALRNGEMKPPSDPLVPPSREFCWEEIFSFVLRQPMLAINLGLIYKAELTFQQEDPNPFAQGGYLYVDLAADSNYSAVERQLFAARIPPLTKGRNLFASVLFPVNHPGNYDQIFPEAD